MLFTKTNREKLIPAVISLLCTLLLCSCSNTKETSSYRPQRSRITYDGTTTIHTRYGNWTPPKGSRRLPNGNIVDSDGAIIGHDETWIDTGQGVG